MIYEVLSAILAIISIIFATWANYSIKGKKYYETYSKIKEQVELYMEIAEKFEDMTGAQKKDFVIQRVAKFASDNGYKVSEELISTIIESLIEFSKRINKK